MKTREHELKHQIQLTKENIAYFETIEQQLQHITVDEIDEIRDELAEQGFMKQRRQRHKKSRQPYVYKHIYPRMEILFLSAKIINKMIT